MDRFPRTAREAFQGRANPAVTPRHSHFAGEFWTTLRGRMTAQRFCLTCGSVGKPVNHTKGSILIEIFLWFMFLIPGLIYSIWRLSTRQKVCRSCQSAHLVPIDSPAARQGAKAIVDVGIGR